MVKDSGEGQDWEGLLGRGLEGRVAEQPWHRVAQEAEQAESSYPQQESVKIWRMWYGSEHLIFCLPNPYPQGPHRHHPSNPLNLHKASHWIAARRRGDLRV